MITPKELTLAVQRGLLALLVLIVLPYGSVQILHTAACTLGLGLFAGGAVLLLREPEKTVLPFRLGFAVAGLFLDIVLLAAVPLPTGWSTSVWAAAEPLLGGVSPALSIHPADSLAAALYLALPLLVYLTGLVLFRTDEEALRLLRFVGYAGGVVALLSIVQFELFPDMLLLWEKRLYMDSLTATFVNRNTAATFLGVVAVVQFGLVLQDGRAVPVREVVRWLVDGGRRPRLGGERRVAFMAAFLLVTLAALFLTKSRGGIGSTMIAFLVIAPLGLAFAGGGGGRSGSRGFGASGNPWLGRVAKAAAGIGVVLLVALLFAGRAALRAEVQGTEDGRFCVLPGILDMIRDRPWTGWGFGTFREAFPAYRDAACGIYGVWDRAHDSYLELAAGLGLPGLAIAVAGQLALLAFFVHGLRTRRSMRPGPLIGLGVLILISIHALVDFSLHLPGMSVFAAAALSGATTISFGRTGPAPAKKAAAAKI